MKQLFTVLALLVVLQLQAQKNDIWWFDTGLKVQYGATGLYNKAVADSDFFSYDIGTGTSFGGKVGLNYGYNGLAIDLMFSNSTAQFETDASPENLKVQYKSMDVYTLYRNARNLGYFELGPKFSFVNDVSRSLEGAVSDDTSLYKSNNIAAVVGFGAYLLGNDGRFSGILGLRFEYGLTDMVDASGHDVGTPVNGPDLYLDGVQTTHPLFVGVSFELNWGIGYFGKASCGERSKFISF